MRQYATMAQWLFALRGGHVTFDKFYAGTYRDWERLGARLMQRWSVPDGVELADVVQELVVGVWKRLPAYDPGRGVSLKRFCVYGAMYAAKRWMNQQRNAYRRSDKSPGRFPIRSGSTGDGKLPLEDLLVDHGPRPDEATELNRMARILRQAMDPDELVRQLVGEHEGLDVFDATLAVNEVRELTGRSRS